jgi:protein-tyrosine phosphatase
MTEILNNLWLGDIDNAKSNSERNIIIVNCAKEISNTRYDYKIELLDGPNELSSFNENIEKVADYINQKIKNNKIILVHCMAGASRSASVVIYYLMKHNNMSFIEAHNFVKNKRPIVNINKWFYKWLYNLHPRF